MAIITNSNFPTYIAESTEIDENTKIPGCSIVGGTIYLTDKGAWKIVGVDKVLSDFYLPTSAPA